MKIGIIGYGFVGKALEAGLTSDVEVIKIDPKLGTHISDISSTNLNFIFICIPTPMQDDGSQSISDIEEIFIELNKCTQISQIVLKSTVTPTNVRKLLKINPTFIYNPEFLREKFALEDFINSKLIIFGGNKDAGITLGEFYTRHTNCVNDKYTFTDHIGASLIKYTINVFLATKVTLFNEINDLLTASNANINWKEFIDIIALDSRIGPSHMDVPGHDGRKGFGGACLPKDLSALINFSEELGINSDLLNTVKKTNNNIRASYKIKTEREIEQNISFNINNEEI